MDSSSAATPWLGLSDEERTAIVAASVAERKERYAREAKFCPACGGSMLGGVPGDLTVLGCCDCHQRVPKYLLGREAVGG